MRQVEIFSRKNRLHSCEMYFSKTTIKYTLYAELYSCFFKVTLLLKKIEGLFNCNIVYILRPITLYN